MSVSSYLRGALRDPGAAEDVHQEVFLEVWRRGSSFDPERGRRSAPGSWSSRAAAPSTTCASASRSPTTRRGPGALMREDEDPSQSPETLVERWRLAVLLAQLPDDEARILRMRFHEGFSQTEIAERTGIPLGTVKTYMVRGLRRLRELMEAGG